MKGLDEIRGKIRLDLQKITDVKVVLGADCLTEEAQNKEKAIDVLRKCAMFA